MKIQLENEKKNSCNMTPYILKMNQGKFLKLFK